ncbi:hypothetical protein [Ferruginibacter sp. HRS2-29]|uniref:hypothetical protein n=1 Tax=Ferruginibacter sp. HRS2-29 TaxID=2487334 RepID=UPI0020CF6786|nr:hypothetical protein [Ferruginibacter sp. HRS2-29]MCP9749623.1 hypothetical protein [Ferruginibacter sp. HRS2-29]
MRYFLSVIILLQLCSCFWGKKPGPGDYVATKVWGWRPVYAHESTYSDLTVSNTPRSVEKAGKIYVYGNKIFQNEIGKGIHVIDNSNSAAAHRIAFWGLPGNTEFSIKGNYLYANNYTDLVVIDLSNNTSPQIIKRIKNSFIAYDQQNPYPWQAPEESGYFDCPNSYPDSMVVNWRRDSISSNSCYKP